MILASISIATLTGSGLFEKAKLAEERTKERQELEDSILADYENQMNKYMGAARDFENSKELYKLSSPT